MLDTRKINAKKIYSKEDLSEERSFTDYPSSSCQHVIGISTSILNNNDNEERTEYPNNKYSYIKKLGDGSASKLYLALDNLTNTKVVIKKISKNEEWRSELNILKILKNSSKRILNYIDFFESSRFAYIVTEYYKGFDLFEYIDINVPYEEEYANKILKEIILCIKECHDKNIIHLDIKCENFMVRNMNTIDILLIDFGHAEKLSPGVIENGYNYGTCYYLCPEGYSRVISDKSDIWSIGICYYLLLTGEYPFDGDDDEYSRNVKNGDIKLSRKLSPSARKIIDACLNYNPKLRPDINQLLEMF
jgi:serine/threonine protein kinase